MALVLISLMSQGVNIVQPRAWKAFARLTDCNQQYLNSIIAVPTAIPLAASLIWLLRCLCIPVLPFFLFHALSINGRHARFQNSIELDALSQSTKQCNKQVVETGPTDA